MNHIENIITYYKKRLPNLVINQTLIKPDFYKPITT